MALIPPPWLREVVRQSQIRGKIHEQVMVVLEAYRNAPDYACPYTNPTLECGDCGTRVMLQESRKYALRAEWWEVVGCHHERGHRWCMPVYRPHSARRCREEQALNGRSALPWIFDGSP